MKRETWLGRVIKTIRLDADFYARAASDVSLNREALLLVIVPSVLIAFLLLCASLGQSDLESVMIFLVSSVAAPAYFFAQTWLIYFIGRRFFHSAVTYVAVRRCLSYAFAARCVIGFFGFISCVGIIGLVWGIAIDYMAVKHALEVEKGPALASVILPHVIIVGSLILLAVLLVDLPAFYHWLLGHFL
jgi:hypothetical protein